MSNLSVRLSIESKELAEEKEEKKSSFISLASLLRSERLLSGQLIDFKERLK